LELTVIENYRGEEFHCRLLWKTRAWNQEYLSGPHLFCVSSLSASTLPLQTSSIVPFQLHSIGYLSCISLKNWCGVRINAVPTTLWNCKEFNINLQHQYRMAGDTCT